jgi:hypothetical protein
MPKKPTRSKKPSKKPHGLSKVTCERIKQDVAQINGLIPSPGALQQSEFPFPPAIAAPISALGQPKMKGMRCKAQVEGRECGYICCSLQQMQEHCGDMHRWRSEQKGRPLKRTPDQPERSHGKGGSIASDFSRRVPSHDILMSNPLRWAHVPTHEWRPGQTSSRRPNRRCSVRLRRPRRRRTV